MGVRFDNLYYNCDKQNFQNVNTFGKQLHYHSFYLTYTNEIPDAGYISPIY